MYYLPVAFGVWLHVFFWGAGAALLVMPRPWIRYWPMLACAAGMALQSLVVWLGAYANLPGTDSYARWTELLPVVVLAFGLRRHGKGLRDLWGFRGLWTLLAANLAALVLPLAFATRGLTTLSFGSCDAADYAAGARVLKEFAHTDRTGFLGLTEVVRVASVDNFFDFWLRLNHFTPSALIAFNGSIFNCAPHEITSVMTAVLLSGSLPVVFWISRAVLRYGAGVSLWVTAIYAFGPITWYAVFHVAMGQLVAAQAIGLVTWAGVAMWRARLTFRRASVFFGVLGVGYTLILGGYNFILPVAFVPAVAYAGGLAIWRGAWQRFAVWLLAMLVPLVVTGLVFWERIAGLAERILLFQAYDFGWRVPVLTPEGWLGLVRDHELTPVFAGVRWVMVGIIIVVTGGALVVAIRRRKAAAYLVACLTVPALCGYVFLNLRGALLETNASYDAYKILAVLYPGILPALGCWAGWGVRAAAPIRWAAMVGMALVLFGNFHIALHFAQRAQVAPLTVSRELIHLQKLEKQPEITSVNMRIADMWSRLWANELLLRTPQYFPTHTYEGRRDTPLRGAWDLVGGFNRIILPDGASRKLSEHYTILDVHSRYLMHVAMDEGWYGPEHAPGSASRWIWTKGNASLRLENPQARSLRVRVGLHARTITRREVALWLNGEHQGSVSVRPQPQIIRGPVITLMSGNSTLELRSEDLAKGISGDARPLGICIYGITFEVLEDSAVSVE